MDHNMVLSYDYANRNRHRRRTNAPPLRTMLMVMVRRWSDTCGISRCSMSRATPEATGRCHRVTIRSVSPWRPPEQQNKQQCIMYPLRWLFWWSSRCGGTILGASPDDGGSPGLSYKPLNTAIGWALALIASIGHRNAAMWLDVWVWGAWCWGWRDVGWQGNIYIGVWHIKMKTRTWRMERNTFMGVLN
jgi:hypothetical protein